MDQANAFQRTQRGLTLIELVVTLAVLAILTSLAAPNFTPLLDRWRLSQATADLEASLNYARSESIRRSGGVSLQRNTNECADQQWQCGWSLRDKDNNVLQTTAATPNVILTASATEDAISFDRWGNFLADGTTGFLTWQAHPKRSTSSEQQTVCLLQNGRFYTRKNSAACN